MSDGTDLSDKSDERARREIARLRDLNQLRVKSEIVKSGGKGCAL